MTKVVVNKCYGGFGLSVKATELYLNKKGFTFTHQKGKWGSDFVVEEDEEFYEGEIERDDPMLVQVVEELGGEANGSYANLTVVEVPDGISWGVEEYDGYEYVAEAHRTW